MSLSREFAAFVADLTYEDLPAAVVDRAKGVTLQALSSALVAHDMPASRQALALMQEEEAGGGGAATVLCHGAKLTKAGAAFVNAETIFAGGKWDTFRMLTHPGTAIMPAALAAAETSGASGKAFLTGIAAGYEVMERMAAEFIPSVMARGFHAGPVFGIFGAAVAAAKIQGFDAGKVHDAIAQCVNLASGNLEGIRSGGRSLREGGAVRNALLAVALAKHGTPGGETVLEGEAGFYHSYAGNNRGELRYSFTGKNRADLAAITEGLGPRLDVPRNAVPGLFDGRLQHRACRCDREAVRGARHHLRADRPHRGGRQLDGDRIPEPGLPDPEPRHRRRPGGRQHALFHRLWRGDPRLSDAASGAPPAPARATRPRCST